MTSSEDIDCPCKRVKCERYKNCEACKAHHANDHKYLIACERLRIKEEKSRK